MWRRPLNSAILTITTHKRLEEVSDGTIAQVVTQMINKCRVKKVQEGLYNGKDLPTEGEEKKEEKEHCSNLSCNCIQFQLTYMNNNPLGW